MNESRKNHTEVFFQDKRDGDIMDERMANFFWVSFEMFLLRCFWKWDCLSARSEKKRESGEAKPEARLLVIRSVD